MLTLLLQRRFLLTLIAICFAIGHGHQLFEQFENHGHGLPNQQADYLQQDDSSSNDADSDPQNSSDTHVLVEHGASAVIPLAAILAALRSAAFALHGETATTLPDAPVLGIEHPPQLA